MEQQMARYFFHVCGDAPDLDNEGTELASINVVRRGATEFAARYLLDHVDAYWYAEGWSVEVTDDQGLMLFSLVFDIVAASATPIARVSTACANL